eukprot:COSAG01_NODE_1811_length_9181_cov_14.633010_2_plen_66_part_00
MLHTTLLPVSSMQQHEEADHLAVPAVTTAAPTLAASRIVAVGCGREVGQRSPFVSQLPVQLVAPG